MKDDIPASDLTPKQRAKADTNEPAHWAWRTISGKRRFNAKLHVWETVGMKSNPNYWGGEAVCTTSAA
jgi:hypothetical protein